MDINKLRNSLMNSELSIASIARKTKLSRTALHNFINGGSIRESTANKINIALHNLNENIVLEGEHNMEAKRVIQLQEESLEYKDLQIQQLQARNKQLEDLQRINPIPTEYEEVVSDYTSTVKVRNIFSFKKIERNIQSVDNVDVLAKALKIDKEVLLDKYFCVGRWINSLDHPINTIIHDQSLQRLRKISKNIPQQDKLLRFSFTAFYMRFPITYVHNGNMLNTLSICKINWSTSPVVETKNVIFD
tara:strand:+ start:778 stop:1518 length:741 start_codon:yes stop_codon:yes gene_type:complete